MLVAVQVLLKPLNTHGLPVSPNAGAYKTAFGFCAADGQVVDAPILDEAEANCAKVVILRIPERLQVPKPAHA